MDKTLQELVQLDLADVKATLKNNGEFFIHFFLGEELKYDVPDFHKRAWKLLTNTSLYRIALAIPRGHAKTTLAKLTVVYYYLFADTKYCIYVSNTAPIAKDACRDIVAFLESDNFVAVFGLPNFVKRSENEGLYIFDLEVVLENGRRISKRCILKAAGAGQQVRGLNIDNTRPQLAVVDDLENDENTATLHQLEKLKKWLYGTFFKAMAKPKFKVIFIGNILVPQSLIKKACEDPSWSSMLFGCLIANGKPLWPDLWPMDAILQDFLEYARQGLVGTWFAEMMNMPIPEGMGLIKPAEIFTKPGVSPADVETCFITIDPAISKKRHGNKTAIVVHALVDGVPQVVDYHTAKMDPTEMFHVTMDKCNEWGTVVIGIEAEAFQEVLQYLFRALAIMENIDNLEIVPLMAGGKKVERLRVWAAMVKAQAYAITEGFFTVIQQLLYYDPSRDTNEDDLIDSCAYGPQMLENYMDLIMQQYTIGVVHRVQTELEIARV